MIDIKELDHNQLNVGLPLVGLYRFRMEQLQNLNLQSNSPANERLVGHIETENNITDGETLRLIDSLVTPVVVEYDHHVHEHYQIAKRFKEPQKIGSPQLGDVWVNRQKKYEFNPLHNHIGLYSFVIWYNIPYTIEEEMKASPYKGDPNDHASGMFEYHTNDSSKFMRLAYSSDWNGTMAVFPSSTAHCVYPFYSTDEERITISGNYYYSL